ncbi:MAG: M24 family metallopeptidase, partial [Phycisphaeraceae bacterium]|nr:M24 family metallopeptidase [Phycisphaeraceae bacterium]
MTKLPIAAQEFDLRHERLRAFLRENDLGAVLAYSPQAEHKWTQTGHVAYLSGWASHDRVVDSVVVVPVVGPAVLLLTGMDFMLEQIAEVSPLQDVRLVKPVDPNSIAAHRKGHGDGPRDFVAETMAILDEAGAAGKDVGIAGLGAMPVPFFELLRNGFGSQLRSIDDIVGRIRAVKTPAEVQLLRKSAALSDLGFETMLQVARPGMRGIEIVAEMEHAVRREGADHAKYWMASGPAPEWSNTRLDIKPHERVLQDGDLMASCSYVVYKGYWCHGQRTGTLGKPCQALSDIYAIAREAQDAGLAQLKPGTRIGDVGAAIRDVGAGHQFDMPGSRYGHGIGLDYSEQPVPLNDTNE